MTCLVFTSFEIFNAKVELIFYKLTRLYLFKQIRLCNDIETNPGPILKQEETLKLLKKYKNNLKIFHLNTQSVIRKKTQLKLLFNNIGENTIFGVSETWMNETHDPNLWNVLKETHLFFNFNRCNSDKSKGGGVALFVPLSLAPKERTDLNLFDKERFESIWIECKESFDRSCKKTMLINISYNPSKQLQSIFLEELTKNIDNAISQNSSIHLLGDYNIDYLDNIEQNNLDSVIIPYGLNVCSLKETTRISKSSYSHIDYIITESSNILIDFVFDSHFKSDHLCSFCIKKTITKKISPKNVYNFDKNKLQSK